MNTPHSGDPVGEVIDAQQHWSRAILANDAGAIADLMHEDWVIVTPVGPIAADSFLGAIGAGVLSHTKMQPASTDDGTPLVRIYGNAAALTQRFVSTEINGGTTRDNDEWMTMIFVHADERWLVSLIHLTPSAPPAPV